MGGLASLIALIEELLEGLQASPKALDDSEITSHPQLNFDILVVNLEVISRAIDQAELIPPQSTDSFDVRGSFSKTEIQDLHSKLGALLSSLEAYLENQKSDRSEIRQRSKVALSYLNSFRSGLLGGVIK